MKRFVFLVICIAVGATLSGCASFREAWDEPVGNESGVGDVQFFHDPFEGDGTSGRDEDR